MQSRSTDGDSRLPNEHFDATVLERFEALPGAEFLWVDHAGKTSCKTFRNEPSRDAAPRWMRLLLGLAERMADELELGRPRILVSVHEQALLVVGRGSSARIGLVSDDIGAAGMAMITTRQWLDSLEDETGGSADAG